MKAHVLIRRASILLGDQYASIEWVDKLPSGGYGFMAIISRQPSWPLRPMLRKIIIRKTFEGVRRAVERDMKAHAK